MNRITLNRFNYKSLLVDVAVVYCIFQNTELVQFDTLVNIIEIFDLV
jgi:hypothetical protein